MCLEYLHKQGCMNVCLEYLYKKGCMNVWCMAGKVWYGLVWFGLVWFSAGCSPGWSVAGKVWFGLVWFGLMDACMLGRACALVINTGNTSAGKNVC